MVYFNGGTLESCGSMPGAAGPPIDYHGHFNLSASLMAGGDVIRIKADEDEWKSNGGKK